MAQQIADALVVLRRRQVEERTGLSRSSLYRRIADQKFPAPVTLNGGRAVGWIEREVTQWLNQCVARRDGAV